MARFGVARRAGERGSLTRLVTAKQPTPIHIHTSRLQEDEPFKKTAEGLGMDPKELRALNADRIKGLQLSAWVKKDTWLQIKPLDEPEEAILAAGLPKPPPLLHLVNRVVAIDGEDDYSYWHRVLAALAPSRVCV